MGVIDNPAQYIFDLDSMGGTPTGWDFLGSVPVPLRQYVRGDVARVLSGINGRTVQPLRCCFPMGQGGRGPFERLRHVRDLGDFPHMLVSCDSGNAFNRRFHRSFVETGHFTGCQPSRVNPALGHLVDPQGWIGVFAVAPFVFLADLERLDDLPAPRSWADLKDPSYRGQVVFGGWRPEGERRFAQVNSFFLLNMLRMFGFSGLRRILANVPTLMHSAQMPRFAGTQASVGGIYVLPWFLADLCPRRSMTKVIWPEDGALAYPLWTTVKRTHEGRMSALVDHFHGAGLAGYLNHNLYPALNADVASPLASEQTIGWLGWDYVRHRSTADDLKAARALFEEIVPCD